MVLWTKLRHYEKNYNTYRNLWNFDLDVIVLEAADTDWDSRCRISKSLYARRVSDFLCKVPQHLFYYF